MNDLTLKQSIGGKFNAQAEENPADWQFVYNDEDHTLSLKVNLKQDSLASDLNKSDVDDLIQWLSQVRKAMES